MTLFDAWIENNIGQAMVSEIEKSKSVIFQYSGGRDSQIAMDFSYPIAAGLGKPCYAVIVDTGAEFPSVMDYAKKHSAEIGVELIVVKGPDAEASMRKSGRFPHPIFKDCIHRLINAPVNSFAKKTGGIIISGHRATQRNGRSSNKFITKLRGGLTLINPHYAFPLDEITGKRSEWPGYSLGFARTACWCCPFQSKKQWDTMKLVYPELWEKMLQMVKTLSVISLDDRPSEGVCVNQMEPYWTGEYGVRLLKDSISGKKKVGHKMTATPLEPTGSLALPLEDFGDWHGPTTKTGKR